MKKIVTILSFIIYTYTSIAQPPGGMPANRSAAKAAIVNAGATEGIQQ